MFEKVNPSHPDKIADRIAGAIVDLAYKLEKEPKVAVEVLIGHGKCNVIIETSSPILEEDVGKIVQRIGGKNIKTYATIIPQDENLAQNQYLKVRCGDNGIFRGVPTENYEHHLSKLVRKLYSKYPTDGKYIYDGESMAIVACQSCCETEELREDIYKYGRKLNPTYMVINPIGDWTGGTDVDTGATNRKLGSDMGEAVTGGGLHGKDLSKADVSVNIEAYLLAQKYNCMVEAFVAIGDSEVEFRLYDDMTSFKPMYIDYEVVVADAKKFIKRQGGFEKFAEWGLI